MSKKKINKAIVTTPSEHAYEPKELSVLLRVLNDPHATDAERESFLGDPVPALRSLAVDGAESDTLRMRVVSDKSWIVRYFAASTAREDATRMAFVNDDNSSVRGAAVERMRGSANLQAFAAIESQRRIERSSVMDIVNRREAELEEAALGL